jgi:signal transduction histidine kinase
MDGYHNFKLVRLSGRLADAGAVVVALMGTAALVGWTFGIETLRSFLHPNRIAMNPMTAVGFVLCGVALWLERPATAAHWRTLAARVMAGVVMFIAAARLIDYYGPIHLPFAIDRLLFPATANTMAPNTAICFFLAGLALLMLDLPIARRHLASQAPALACGTLALFSLTGYLYDIVALYRISTFIPMAINTSATFAVLAAAILLARPFREPVAVLVSSTSGGTLARQILPVVLITPLVLGWICMVGEHRDLYSSDFAISLFAIGSVLIFVIVGWWSAVKIERIDAERQRAHDTIQRQNIELEDAIQSERDTHAALKQTQSTLVQTEKLAALGQLVAGVAHEINNPLAFVSNNVAVLQRDAASIVELLMEYRAADGLIRAHDPALAQKLKEASEWIDLDYTAGNLREVAERCREGLRRIQQIVKDLRDFARIDDNCIEEADLNRSLQSTINIVRGQARKKQLRIIEDLGTLPILKCYPAKINQVVLNLLTNAIDASVDGGVIKVATRAADDEVHIEVTDTGHGIDPAIVERIFDPFFTTKKQGEGMGLGLSISYGIVRDHGGAIEVQSKPGEGATFRVRLPTKPRFRSTDGASASDDLPQETARS